MNRGEIVEKEEIYNLLIKGRPSTLRKVDLEVYIQSLEDKNKELEQQVESMKCCGNCKFDDLYGDCTNELNGFGTCISENFKLWK